MVQELQSGEPQQPILGNNFATDLKVGRNAASLIDFTRDDEITFRVNGEDELELLPPPQTSSLSLHLGSSNHPFNNGYIASVYVGDGTNAGVITTNGAQDLVLNTNAGSSSGSITITDAANGNIDLKPNGTGLTLIDGAGIYRADSNNSSLFIGHGSQISTVNANNAYFNIGLGQTALDSLNGGDYNVAIGYSASTALTSGVKNVTVGHNAALTLPEEETLLQEKKLFIKVRSGNIQSAPSTSTITLDSSALAEDEHTMDMQLPLPMCPIQELLLEQLVTMLDQQKLQH